MHEELEELGDFGGAAVQRCLWNECGDATEEVRMRSGACGGEG